MVQDKGIAPHVPVWDRSERKDGTIPSSEFVWIEQANEYRCPQGHALLSDRRQFTKPRDRITKASTAIWLHSNLELGPDRPQRTSPSPGTPTRPARRHGGPSRGAMPEPRILARPVGALSPGRRSPPSIARPR